MREMPALVIRRAGARAEVMAPAAEAHWPHQSRGSAHRRDRRRHMRRPMALYNMSARPASTMPKCMSGKPPVDNLIIYAA